MSMYIDNATMKRVARFFSVRRIAEESGINANTLQSLMHRGSLDGDPGVMKKIALTLAEKGIFIRREDENMLEFGARVSEYCIAHHKVPMEES